jgi:hypothetical protein
MILEDWGFRIIVPETPEYRHSDLPTTDWFSKK